jgi:hypothetical protein
MIAEQWIGKDEKGIGSGLTGGIILVFVWRNWGKLWKQDSQSLSPDLNLGPAEDEAEWESPGYWDENIQESQQIM